MRSEKGASCMRKVAEERRRKAFEQADDSSLQDRRDQDLGSGDSREWVHFESVLCISEARLSWYMLLLGQGSRQEVSHGTFSRPGGPVSSEISLEPLVGFGWRGANCRYYPATQQSFLRVEVSGEVSGPTPASLDSVAWKKALLMFSFFASASPEMYGMGGLAF